MSRGGLRRVVGARGRILGLGGALPAVLEKGGLCWCGPVEWVRSGARVY